MVLNRCLAMVAASVAVVRSCSGWVRRRLRREDGTVRDSLLFSIIAEEWPSVRAQLR